ncbi:MAG: LacI family DNA-binding transcriptional regulator [Gordonia sp. (in: high G+C Gram-positive bacteria)]
MQDVARLAKVSAKTVSRVYNNDPHVDPETRARVEEALKAVNYVPNTMARSFRSGHAAAVGLVVPDIADPFFAEIGRAVETRARESGMGVFITSLGSNPDQEQALVDSLLGRQLSGLIIAPISTDQSYLARWLGRTPTVFVDRAPRGVHADSFVDDDHGGAFVAVTHLVNHGHRRIALLGDNPSIPTMHNRVAGYRDALATHGLPFDDDLVVDGVYTRDDAYRVIGKLINIDAHRRPTALFVSNARSAMAALPAIKELAAGMAFVVFGDFPLADVVSPSVTVIDQNPSALGAQATERLLDRIAHPQRRMRRRNVLSVTLIERESGAL